MAREVPTAPLPSSIFGRICVCKSTTAAALLSILKNKMESIDRFKPSIFEAEGFLFCQNSPLFHFKDGETRQRLLLPWEAWSGFLCVPRTGANVPMLLLYSALEQAWNTVWLLHVCLPKTRALITQSNDTT